MARKLTVSDSLRNMPLLERCSDKEIAAIESIVTEVHPPEGRVLFEEGAIGNELIMIDSGTAEVTRSGVTLATLGPGDHAGELAILDEMPRTATITATSPMTLKVIERRDFRQLLKDSPGIAQTMLASLARRLAEADEKVARLSD